MEEFKLTVYDCINYLQEIGWTELIDGRWRDKVVSDLKERFPDISEDLLNKVLSIVIWE